MTLVNDLAAGQKYVLTFSKLCCMVTNDRFHYPVWRANNVTEYDAWVACVAIVCFTVLIIRFGPAAS